MINTYYQQIIFYCKIISSLRFNVDKVGSHCLFIIWIVILYNHFIKIFNLSKLHFKSFSSWFFVKLLSDDDEQRVKECLFILTFMFIPVEETWQNLFILKYYGCGKVWISLSIKLGDERQRMSPLFQFCLFLFNQIVFVKLVRNFRFIKLVFYFKIENIGTILDPTFCFVSPYLKRNVSELHSMDHFYSVLLWLVFMNRESLDMRINNCSSQDEVKISIYFHSFHQCLFHHKIRFFVIPLFKGTYWIYNLINSKHELHELLEMLVLNLIRFLSFVVFIALHKAIQC